MEKLEKLTRGLIQGPGCQVRDNNSHDSYFTGNRISKVMSLAPGHRANGHRWTKPVLRFLPLGWAPKALCMGCLVHFSNLISCFII